MFWAYASWGNNLPACTEFNFEESDSIPNSCFEILVWWFQSFDSIFVLWQELNTHSLFTFFLASTISETSVACLRFKGQISFRMFVYLWEFFLPFTSFNILLFFWDMWIISILYSLPFLIIFIYFGFIFHSLPFLLFPL